MSDGGDPQAGAIEVTTRYMAMAFLLSMVKTRVAVDGQSYELPWGTNTFPVRPGQHHVRVSFKYLMPSDAGANEVDVEVSPGQTVRVGYRAPWLVFLKGPITVNGPVPASVAPAGRGPGPAGRPAANAGVGAAPNWYPDPSSRHELRYWDGQSWTSHVSDQGVAGSDPA